MHCRSALLLASICSIAAAQPPADEAKLNGPLTIVLRSDQAASPETLSALEREVESLVSPSGIHISWTSNPEPPQVYQQVAIVTLRGVCRADGPVRGSAQTAQPGVIPLGQTQVVDGKVLPFADVRCDPIRKLIARELYTKPSKERDELLGRALGRVMAHELYHIVLRSTSHGTNGLARASQNSADLTADRDPFAPSDERRLSQTSAFEVTDTFSASGR